MSRDNVSRRDAGGEWKAEVAKQQRREGRYRSFVVICSFLAGVGVLVFYVVREWRIWSR